MKTIIALLLTAIASFAAEPAPNLLEKILKEPKSKDLLMVDIIPIKFTYTYNNLTFGNGWMVIKPEQGGEYKAGTVSVEAKHEPMVTKVGDKWVIKFKP